MRLKLHLHGQRAQQMAENWVDGCFTCTQVFTHAAKISHCWPRAATARHQVDKCCAMEGCMYMVKCQKDLTFAASLEACLDSHGADWNMAAL